MGDCSPWVGDIQEQSISLIMHALDAEAITYHITPCRCNVGFVEILEEILGYFCPLFIELECIEPARGAEYLRESTGE